MEKLERLKEEQLTIVGKISESIINAEEGKKVTKGKTQRAQEKTQKAEGKKKTKGAKEGNAKKGRKGKLEE